MSPAPGLELLGGHLAENRQVHAREHVEQMIIEVPEYFVGNDQAIVELANQQDQSVVAAVRPELDAMQEQVAKLEAKLFEQERTIRTTLTMLIEWIDGEMEQTKAA